MQWLTRTLWLVLIAMVMFAAATYVLVSARDNEERVLAAVAILGAVAVIVGNVHGNGNGK
jgi:hypothetical protein